MVVFQLAREPDEEEPLDNESSYAAKAKTATEGAVDVDGAVPDELVHESRAVPEPCPSMFFLLLILSALEYSDNSCDRNADSIPHFCAELLPDLCWRASEVVGSLL